MGTSLTKFDEKYPQISKVVANLSPDERMDLFLTIRDRVKTDLGSALGVSSSDQIRAKNGAQSMAFLIEMLPNIWRVLENEPRYTSHTWLDVGPGSGFGAGLLATLYSGTMLGHQLKVSVLDIRPDFSDLIRAESEAIEEFIHGDLFDLDRTFDYVSASHVIEHVPQPVEFVRRLQEVARKRVFILTPWKERADMLTRGHANIFNERFLEQLGNPEYKLMQSVAWGAFLNPRYEMLYLELPGKSPTKGS